MIDRLSANHLFVLVMAIIIVTVLLAIFDAIELDASAWFAFVLALFGTAGAAVAIDRTNSRSKQ